MRTSPPSDRGSASLLRQKMHQYLGIAARLPRSRKFGAQALVVVDLAVVGQYLGARTPWAGGRPRTNPGSRAGGEPSATPGWLHAPSPSGPRCRRRCAMLLGELEAGPRTYNTGYSTHGRQSSAAGSRCTAGHRAAVRLGCAWSCKDMATPADQRLLELLEKWLDSLELHAKYSSLDDDSYWKIQPWVEHQRPSRWIIDLAMQKTIALANPRPRARQRRATRGIPIPWS